MQKNSNNKITNKKSLYYFLKNIIKKIFKYRKINFIIKKS